MDGSILKAVRLAAVLVMSAGLFVVASGSAASAAPVAGITELRDAVDAANADPGNETIDLVPGTTYSISGDQCADQFGDDDDENVTGDLDVFLVDDSSNPQDLTIQTPSGTAAIIEVSCPLTRAIETIVPVNGFAVAENTSVGTLTLRNVIVRGGRAPDEGVNDRNGGSGGGVFAPLANLVFENVTFDDNRADDGDDGDDDIPNGGEGGVGGAVALRGGTLTVTGSTFTDNHAGNGGAGWTNTCDVPFEIPAGRGGDGGGGGAIFAFAIGSPIEMSIETSTFSSNTAGDGGNGGDGTPAACNVPGFGNDGGAGGDGGAISVSQRGTAYSIGHSAFSQNTAGDGGNGGHGADGANAANDVQQQGEINAAATGGSGASGGFAGNGGSGGGVSNTDNIRSLQAQPTADRVIANSTFDSNASGNGGAGGDGGNGGAGSGQDPQGLGGDGRDGGCGGNGGAITDVDSRSLCAEEEGFAAAAQVEGALELVHLTVTENGNGGAGGTGGTPGAGGAATGAAGKSIGGSISSSDLEATAIVVGTSTEDANDCNYPEEAGGPLFASSSFSTDDSCGFGEGSVQPFTSFALTALGDHGGPTATRVPQVGSILLNVVEAIECSVDDDQRLFVRPTGSGCEVGATEVAPITLEVTKTAFDDSVPAGEEISFKLTVKNTSTNTPKPGVTVADSNCGPASLNEGDTNHNGTLDPGETWIYTCTATPTVVGEFSNTVTFTVVDADNLSVSAQATDTVTVTAAGVVGEELARTGKHTGQLTRYGFALLGVGTVLVLRRPYGRHYRPRRKPAHRHSRGRFRPFG